MVKDVNHILDEMECYGSENMFVCIDDNTCGLLAHNTESSCENTLCAMRDNGGIIAHRYMYEMEMIQGMKHKS